MPKRTFEQECERKINLFNAWIAYLTDLHTRFSGESPEEHYEGLAAVMNLSEDQIELKLEDGTRLQIPVSPEICLHSRRLDSLYVILAYRQGRWWPFDIISIGSHLDPDKTESHVTFNPSYANPDRSTADVLHS